MGGGWSGTLAQLIPVTVIQTTTNKNILRKKNIIRRAGRARIRQRLAQDRTELDYAVGENRTRDLSITDGSIN